MRSLLRCSLLALVAGAALALSTAAAQAAPGIESFFAANCKKSVCKKQPSAEKELEQAKSEGFTQAGGHPNFGITDFTVSTVGGKGEIPEGLPGGAVTHVRTDVAPGVSTNPETVAKCSFAEFGEKEALPETGFYPAPKCKPETELGENKVVVFAGEAGDVPISGLVYNLLQPTGLASDFGVALKLPIPLTKGALEKAFAEKGHPFGKKLEEELEEKQYYAHTLIEGSVEWGAEAAGTGKADYHDYFEIKVSPKLPLVSSRLVFKGNIGERGFLTNPTSCTGTGPQTTTTLKLSYASGEAAEAKYSPPIGPENCGIVPFNPGFSLSQGNKGFDSPDALSTEFTLPHNTVEEEEEEGTPDSSQVKKAEVVLPPGITINPAAAAGLEACTPEQIGIGTKNAVACPEGSRLGTVTLTVPGLPPESLKGYLFLGRPASGPITGPPYITYLEAESARYGIVVRLRGVTVPNEATGQLTTTFSENPEQPFSSLVVHFNGGPIAPLANLVTCEASAATAIFTPFTNTAAKAPLSSFEITGCPATLPFAPTQSTLSEPAQGGASSTFTLDLTRPQGHQYVTGLKNVLPPGLLGTIPAVSLCGEAEANAGTCSAASHIGNVTVAAGSGIPYNFHGRVYLTGPYEGAPYGLSIVVNPVAAAFNLKPVVARARIEVKPDTAQVIVTDTKVPTIASGVPTRLRSLTVTINRQGFERNPTNCGVLATTTTLTGSLGASATVSTPFQVEGCNSLPFKPSFSASTSGKTSKANGASLEVRMSQGPGEANIGSVKTSLPIALPSRLTTLQKACLEATFAANPASCPEGSNVGTATAITPVLPKPMSGAAYLVSHGGGAFPDLDLVLEGNNGIRVILVGNTDIKKGITTTTFAATPDVPVSSFVLKLPTGPHSALAANGNLCRQKLVMPTTITGQNGAQIKQNTPISTTGCAVRIVSHRVSGSTAILKVQVYEAGRLNAAGSSLRGVSQRIGRASTITLKIPLSAGGRHRHRPFRTRVRVSFVPAAKGVARSSASALVRFR